MPPDGRRFGNLPHPFRYLVTLVRMRHEREGRRGGGRSLDLTHLGSDATGKDSHNSFEMEE